MEVKTLSQFPLEVLVNIFDFCDIKTLKHLISVTSSFYDIIIGNQLLSGKFTLKIDEHLNSDSSFDRLLKSERKFTKLLVIPRKSDNFVLNILEEYLEKNGEAILEIHFRKESANDRFLMKSIYKVFQMMPNVEKISFKGNGWVLKNGGASPLLPFNNLKEILLLRDHR